MITSKNVERVNSFHILKKAVNLMNTISKKYFWIQLTSALLQSGLPVVSLLIMQRILNLLQSDLNAKIIVKWIILYISIDIFQSIYQSFFTLYSTKINLEFNLWIKKQALKKCSSLSVTDYENSEVYDKIRRAENAENGSITIYINAFVHIIGIIFTTLSYSFILVTLDIKLVPIILFVPIIKYLITVWINKQRFLLNYNRTSEDRERWYWNFLITTGNSFKDLKLNNLCDYFIKKYEVYTEKFNIEDYSLTKKSTTLITLFTLLEQIIDGGIFVYIIFKGISGTILIGSVVTYTRSLIQAKTSVQNLLQKYAEMKRLELDIGQLFSLLDMKGEVKEGDIKVSHIKSIEAKNLSYKYNGQNNYALKNVSFIIKKGDIMAIVGQNGSGKTTLTKILLGLYLNYEGELLINGVEMKKLDIDTYRKACSGLFQDFTKYEATVQDNIIYGNIELQNNRKKIEELFNFFNLCKISLKKNIEDILKTQLGNWFKTGKQISTGQWQRLALCRTFAKSASLYILDEPSASLDAVSDEEITLRYCKLMQGYIGIVVAHRLQSISKYVSNIIVLQNGEVVENGSHEELLSMDGVYRKLYSK